MSDNFNDFSDNDFENDRVYTFDPKDLTAIMERLQAATEFLSNCDLEDLEEMWQKFQKKDQDGMYQMSLEIVSKFTDFLVSDALNALVAKNLIDYEWSDEHNDFVFKCVDSSGA